MSTHRVALILLVFCGGMWGASWSVLDVTPAGVEARHQLEGSEPPSEDVVWGPQVLSIAAQDQGTSRVVATLIVAGGAGVLVVGLISSLLLFATSRLAMRPALRVHRAIGASMRQLKRGVGIEAVVATAVVAVGAAALGSVLGQASAAVWNRGGAPPVRAAVAEPLLAIVLLAPAVAVALVGLFRASIPEAPIAPTRRPRHVPDPFSGLAVTQVAIAVAALVVVALIPTRGPVGGATNAGIQVDLHSSAPVDTPRIVEAVSGVPGVTGVLVTSPGGWVGQGTVDFLLSECGRCSIGGLPTPLKGERAAHLWTGPGTLNALDIQIVEGNGFRSVDFERHTKKVLVSRAFARANFEGGNALGRRVRVGQDPDAWHEVVGVVAVGPAAVAPGASGLPSAWVVLPAHAEALHAVSLRVSGQASADVVLRAATRVGDGTFGVAAATSRVHARLTAPTRWFRGWLSLMGMLAMLVSLAGVFSATRAQVRQRTGELGIRRAVGATRRTIVRTVMGQSARVALIGIPMGAWVATFALHAVRQTTGAALPSAAAAAGIVGTVLVACLGGSLVPALRAARLPPAAALRAASLDTS